MRLLLLLTLTYSIHAQESTEKPVEDTSPKVTGTTIEPLVTTVEPVESTVEPQVTTVEPLESTVHTEVSTDIGSTITTVKSTTTKAHNQNEYGDEVVTPASHGKTIAKAHGEKDTRVVPAKVANRHALFFSGYDKDRSARSRRAAAAAQNGYGDEPITPAANQYGGSDYEEGTTTQTTTTTTKAQNGYGDEAVVPSASDSPYAPQPEIEYAPVDTYSPPTPAVTDGGYKRIRRGSQNGYGDEPVTPADDGYGSAVTGGGQDEYAPATVSQSGYGEESVQKSGYNRRRRSNGYGDEQVTPSSGGKGSGYEAEKEETHGVQTQEGVTHPPRETSGY